MFVKKRYLIILGLITFTILSCQKDLTQSEKIVNSAIYFNSNLEVIPEEMISSMINSKVILIGETHYVKEHSEFLSTLIKGLYKNGFRIILLEGMQAQSHMYNLYAMNKMDVDEKELGVFYELLSDIKEINKELELENEPLIRIANVDLNHMKYIYKETLIKILDYYEIIGNLHEYAQNLNFDSEDYKYDIYKIIDEVKIAKGCTQEIAEIIIDISEKEIISLEIKEKWANDKSTQLREDFIYDEIASVINNLQDNEKVVINLGLWHVQKENQWDLGEKGLKTVGELLQGKYKDDLYHFFVFGYKGIRKENLWNSNRIDINMIDNDLPENIIKKLGRKDSNKNTFINFKGMEFIEEENIGFYKEVITIVPEQIIDGILIYSDISILDSSLQFEKE